MTIAEMHVMFRQFAQQMGMQNVRAILPEQIDLLINTSIGDTVNQLIRSTVGVTNDRIITDNSKILQINSLRPLYKVDEIVVNKANGFVFKAADRFNGRFNVNLDTKISVPVSGGGTENVSTEEQRVFNEYLFIVDFAINYVPLNNPGDNVGWGTDDGDDIVPNDDFITNPYPIRLIDDAFLADTLNDFLLKPVLRSPVMTIVNNDLDIYFGEMKNQGVNKGYTLEHDLIPYKLRMSYIAKPCKVAYLADVGGKNIDCDLPENLHIDIVKHAVELYQQIAGRGLAPQQQQENVNNGETTTPQQRQ